jgi:hypothetical protein
MILRAYTIIHILISLIGIFTGVVVLFGLLAGKRLDGWLLNEFLKEHRKVEEQQATITQVKATVAKQAAIIAQQENDFQTTAAEQQAEIKALRASLKEQAWQIQKVSTQLDSKKSAPQLVAND